MWRVGDGDVRVLHRDLLHHPAPQLPGVHQHVRLVHQRQVLARPPGRPLERVPDHPLHAEVGVQRHLGGDLVRGVLAQQSAVAGVRALGALPQHHQVDGLVAGQRARHARVQPGRTEVDVVVELEPDPQQQTALEDAGRHRRVADGAEQDRVVLAQLAQHRVRQQFAGAVPAGGAEVVLGGRDAGHDAPQDLQALRDHLGTDAIAGDDRELHR